ncbi:hypothetical protein EV363DRAFT_1151195 [Boletus edulis]|uniref:Uncharacterized protein n=1 Tax=Boletus edulis BED1 TaxID=1328754 RepID=A0AAD4BK32_BOLED|nr:hypothetical protein EV363DRAFT_1151195 [Boletus edulis]KAF8433247.1 hypothetical protein L210DRAFT_3633179 [Boletus edulis BED1]
MPTSGTVLVQFQKNRCWPAVHFNCSPILCPVLRVTAGKAIQLRACLRHLEDVQGILYSSTSNRSSRRVLGLEVLNELDTVKAALMIDSGGGRSTRSGWELDLLERGVKGLATG